MGLAAESDQQASVLRRTESPHRIPRRHCLCQDGGALLDYPHERTATVSRPDSGAGTIGGRPARPSRTSRLGGTFCPTAGRCAHSQDHPRLAGQARGAGRAYRHTPDAGLWRRGVQCLLRPIPRKRGQVAGVHARRATRRRRPAWRCGSTTSAAIPPATPAASRCAITRSGKRAGCSIADTETQGGAVTLELPPGQAGAGGSLPGSRRPDRLGAEGGPRGAGPRRQAELAGARRPLARAGGHREPPLRRHARRRESPRQDPLRQPAACRSRRRASSR